MATTIVSIVYITLSHFYFIPAILFYLEKKSAKPLTVNTGLLHKKFLTAEGDTVSLSGEKIKIIDMFFVGCMPCELKRAMLEEVRNELPSQKFSIILICNSRISTFKEFKDYCSKYPPNSQIKILYDFDNAMQNYVPDLEGFPFEIIVKDTLSIKQYLGFDKETYDLNKEERVSLLKKICNE